MLRTGFWRVGLPTSALVGSLVALTSACLTGQEPAQPNRPIAAPDPVLIHTQAKPDDYVGEQVCVSCHPAPTDSINKSPHALYVRNPKLPLDKRGCEGCHGPGGPHLANMEDPATIPLHIFNPLRATPQQEAAMCLRCHREVMSAAHWKRTPHATGNVRCNDCHYNHKPDQLRPEEKAARDRTPRQPAFAAVRETGKLLRADEATVCGKCHARETAEFRSAYHHPLPEGRMLCSDCHELHPTRQTPRKRAANVQPRGESAACLTCHGEIAGPFVYEHDPVAGWTGDGCVECHKPHGSHNPRLLKSFSRGLCAQCHSDMHNNHYPGRTCWDTGCHAALHGSNRDQYLRTR